ncbi:hypothetical protein F443_12333 [Phytophthora nicotianae P1569]|uniref:Uncharacterized protein n=1 Tax=Phytophthora nicotianae P1569 TaxID=1317065 RepID=V9EVQ8_PHYNI|nr:hypothetical protein F443_12333 [Phytophthora nicotianae P1569]
MVRLRTLNESAKLRFKTKLRSVLRQDTRKGSTFKMLHHYFNLLEFIDRDDENLAEFIPSASENKKLKVLLTTLELIQSVSMQLQPDGVTLWEVCVLFDALLKEMSALKRYLGATGSIVASPDFESACVKIQSDKQNPMSRQEKAACQRFLREPQNEVNLQGSSQQGFAASVLKKARLDVARATYGLDLHSLLPISLEMVLCLSVNECYWGAETIHQCLD